MSRALRAAFVGAVLIAGTGAAFSAQAADPAFCRDYAANAVHQYEDLSNRPRCMDQVRDYTRWSSNYANHYDWCRNVSRDQAWAERNARRDFLDNCGPYREGYRDPGDYDRYDRRY